MIRTVEQLIGDFRSDVYDRADLDDAGNQRDTLWSDADALRYLNSAAARLASDTLMLRERFEFTTSALDPLVFFPFDRVIDVLSIKFSAPGYPSSARRSLVKFDIDEGIVRDDYGVLIITAPDLDAQGTPTHYTRDYDNRFLRMYPIPYIAGTLVIYAIVLPQELFPGMPLPFTAQQDFDLLLMWMKKQAYAKQDADTLDMERSLAFENEYKRTVKDRKSEIDRIRRDTGLLEPR